MPNYSTNLKTWGDTGAEFPNGYSYLEGEQPVDDWDNFVTHNLIQDVQHLISVTNSPVTVAGNDVELGGSTAVAHADLSNIGANDHHTPPSAGTGLTDSSNTFILDESYSATWSSSHTFQSGLSSAGNVNVSSGQYQIGGNTLAQSVPVSGQVQLSSGSATIDTAISATDATFMVALGVDDPNADVKVSGRLVWDDSAGTYKIEIVETQTAVGNPTVNYDVVRVR